MLIYGALEAEQSAERDPIDGGNGPVDGGNDPVDGGNDPVDGGNGAIDRQMRPKTAISEKTPF